MIHITHHNNMDRYFLFCQNFFVFIFRVHISHCDSLIYTCVLLIMLIWISLCSVKILFVYNRILLAMLSQKCIRSNSVEKQSQIYNNMINITNLSDLSHCMYLSDCTVNIQSSYVFTHLKHLNAIDQTLCIL